MRLFPGIGHSVVSAVLKTKELHGLILETYGTGNAPTLDWFLDEIRSFIAEGGIVLNVTQCPAGAVEMGLYETSAGLRAAGVISGKDITTEAAVTKMMILLGSSLPKAKVETLLSKALSGEMS